MKLRNKKTGKITEVYVVYDGLKIGNDLSDNSRLYKSLEELEEDWEDYKPIEPLIKDEKIRKTVRAWADANDIERVWHECSSCWLRGNGLSIEMENEIDELDQGNYTIAELCGEEEE